MKNKDKSRRQQHFSCGATGFNLLNEGDAQLIKERVEQRVKSIKRNILGYHAIQHQQQREG